MANYLESLLGEDELQQAKNQALSSGLMQAGFAGLLGSGPSLLPTSAGQAIGQAGLAGMSAYDSALDQAKQDISQKSIQGIISGTLSGSGNNVANTENMADKFTKLAERFAPIDPTKSKLYYDLAEQSRGKSEKFTGNLANSALELFGTADLAKLTPEQRTQAAKYTQSQAMSTASAGKTTVTNILGGESLTPFQKKLDESFATDAIAWSSGGGQDMVSQLAQLEPVIAALERGEPITGLSVSLQPDLMLALTNPNALSSRDNVESVVQRNLRTILGAQFTEKEGERLIARAYNPKLNPEENARRLRRLFMQMSESAKEKQSMVDFATNNGTLRGYKGKMPQLEDFRRAIDGPNTNENTGSKSTPKKSLDQIFGAQ
jgi:hypothetical protein